MTIPGSMRVGRWGRWPVGCLGALALIALVEGLIARRPIETLTAVQWEYRLARNRASGQVNDSPILAFGDSMLKLGLAPERLTAATGRRAYNFGLTATQAPAAFYLLHRALAAGARPSAVLIECFPNQLASDPAINADHWPLLLDLDESFDLTAGHGDWSTFARLAVRHLLPSIRAAQKIRRCVALSFKDQPNIEREALVVGLRNWEANRGFQLNAVPGPPVNLDHWRLGYFHARAVHPTNRDYVERFLNLADTHAIPVFWLLPPYQPTMQLDCEQTGFDQFHERFIRRLMARHPQLRVIDGRHSNYDPALFVDPHHLAGAGALAFSTQVGAVLRRFLDEPQSLTTAWVDLPSYEPDRSVNAIETLDQSREVVLQAGLLRR